MTEFPLLIQANPGAGAIAIADAEEKLKRCYPMIVVILEEAGIYDLVAAYMAEHFLAFGDHVEPMIAVHRVASWSAVGQLLDRLEGGLVLSPELDDHQVLRTAFALTRDASARLPECILV